ncbi:DUF6660 family protein [Leadbetterella sp. DM7]|uniref:DUF6660 family protein n=1 Tax=Leadbetterella sp. DM7 TaxID=3235085 RepID=UPI00349EA763
MRLFAYIFSIYILALSVVPCSDAYNDCQNDTAYKEYSQAHNHHTDHNDNCSPFCTCTCCSTSVNLKFTSHKFQITKLVVSSQITYPVRDFSFVSNYYGNIWQPPKIKA